MASNNTIIEPVVQSRLNKAPIDKFVFMFILPEALQKIDTNGRGKGQVNSKSVQFSLNQFPEPGVRSKGISQRFAAGNLYIPSYSKEPADLLTIKFDIDNEFNNYATINEWLNLLQDEKEAIPDPRNLITDKERFVESKYWTDLYAYGLDEYNKIKVQFRYTQAFPTELSGFTYDYRNTGPIEVGATFCYSQRWVSYPDTDLDQFRMS